MLLPDLFCDERDSFADDLQVVELARYTGVGLLPEMGSSLMTRSLGKSITTEPLPKASAVHARSEATWARARHALSFRAVETVRREAPLRPHRQLL